MNISDPPSPFHRTRVRNGILQMIASPSYTHGITLAMNAGAQSADTARRKFRLFALDVDRYVRQRHRVDRLPSAKRLDAIAFPEKLETNAHMHLVADLGSGYLGRPFDAIHQRAFEQVWLHHTAGAGSIEIKAPLDDGWLRYITKDLNPNDPIFFLSQDFHSGTKVIQSWACDPDWLLAAYE